MTKVHQFPRVAKPLRTLDRIDRKILEVLQNNARSSNIQISGHVNLSETPCAERTRRLFRSGYIKASKAILNPALLGLNLLAYVEVTLRNNTPEALRSFRECILQMHHVQECHAVSGSFDLLMKVRVPDMSTYQAFTERLSASLPNIASMRSILVVDELKETTDLVLA